MATVSYKVCDRCGQKMVYSGWTAKIKGFKKFGLKLNILKLFNGNPDGYSYSERDYELCSDCTKQFEEFIRMKGVSENGINKSSME